MFGSCDAWHSIMILARTLTRRGSTVTGSRARGCMFTLSPHLLSCDTSTTSIGLRIAKMSASNAALEGCVSSLRSSMSLLDSSIHILDSGVSDYPRLTKVLQSTRVSSAYIFPIFCFFNLQTLSWYCLPLACSKLNNRSLHSTLNSSPKQTSILHNPPSYPRSDPKWRISFPGSRLTLTNSSDGSSLLLQNAISKKDA